MWMVYSSFCEFHDLSSKNKQTKNPKLVYYSDSPCYLFLKDVQLSSHPLPLDLTSFLASLPQWSLHCIKWSNNYNYLIERKIEKKLQEKSLFVFFRPLPSFSSSFISLSFFWITLCIVLKIIYKYYINIIFVFTFILHILYRHVFTS